MLSILIYYCYCYYYYTIPYLSNLSGNKTLSRSREKTLPDITRKPNIPPSIANLEKFLKRLSTYCYYFSLRFYLDIFFLYGFPPYIYIYNQPKYVLSIRLCFFRPRKSLVILDGVENRRKREEIHIRWHLIFLIGRGRGDFPSVRGRAKGGKGGWSKGKGGAKGVQR